MSALICIAITHTSTSLPLPPPPPSPSTAPRTVRWAGFWEGSGLERHDWGDATHFTSRSGVKVWLRLQLMLKGWPEITSAPAGERNEATQKDVFLTFCGRCKDYSCRKSIHTFHKCYSFAVRKAGWWVFAVTVGVLSSVKQSVFEIKWNPQLLKYLRAATEAYSVLTQNHSL